jgi:hypothetical protein
VEEYLVHFAEIIRKDGRSEFSEENSRISVSRQISQRSRGDTVKRRKVQSSGGAGP